MKACKTITVNEHGEFVTASGRVFRPLYKDLLDNMPKDIVRELARRRRAELDATDK